MKAWAIAGMLLVASTGGGAPRSWWSPLAERLGLEHPPPAHDPVIDVFDPQGRTSAMLSALGLKTRPWNGMQGPQLLVIGRDALSGAEAPPGDLEKFAAIGGKLLLMPHDPVWLREFVGLDPAAESSQRLLPTDAARALFQTADLASLLPASRSDEAGPPATTAVRKPDRGGWNPLLECAPNPAYTPLMEAGFGWGRITWCFLDLDAARPAARDLILRLIRHAGRPVEGTAPDWRDDRDANRRLFDPAPQALIATGPFRWKQILALPATADPATPAPDPGLSPEAELAVAPDANDADWPRLGTGTLPGPVPGEIVIRTALALPSAWSGHAIGFRLRTPAGLPGEMPQYLPPLPGSVFFLNGVPAGSSPSNPAVLAFPPGGSKSGVNILAGRLFDATRPPNLGTPAPGISFEIRPVDPPSTQGFYLGGR